MRSVKEEILPKMVAGEQQRSESSICVVDGRPIAKIQPSRITLQNIQIEKLSEEAKSSRFFLHRRAPELSADERQIVDCSSVTVFSLSHRLFKFMLTPV